MESETGGMFQIEDLVRTGKGKQFHFVVERMMVGWIGQVRPGLPQL